MSNLQLLASVEVRAEEAPEQEGGTKLRRFSMLAYTGGAMKVGFGWPVVVDLAGMAVPSEKRPILLNHDLERIVGHSEAIEVSSSRIKVSGVISGVGDDATQVAALAANGFPWQASIGASVERMEFVDRGQTVKVNGKNFAGPIYVARKTTLGEISFVPLGADGNTSATVAAIWNGGDVMTFEAWLSARGFDPAAMTEQQKSTLQAAFQAEQQREIVVPTPEQLVTETRQALAAESERVAAIRRICSQYLNPTIATASGQASLESHAIAEGWDTNRTELEALRSVRASVRVHTPQVPQVSAEVLECALATSGKLPGVERQFAPQTLEASAKLFRRGIGLQELLVEAARMNGYSGRGLVRSDLRDILATAFSNLSLPGILSNNANKFLLAGFVSVDQAWAVISAKRAVSDFKTVSSYRLTGGFDFLKVGPGGELQHATTGELTYTNKAETYGRMYAITRQDIINDDLGALTAVPQRIGRGAALQLNRVFWTEFMDNASFFTTGNNSFFAGASTVLGSEGLRKGVEMLRKQTGPDGHPLALTPKFLLVPPELESIADELYTSTNINTGGAASTEKVPNRNTFAGKYQPVVSPYLSNSSYGGSSATAWYLLVDPADIAVIEVAFLNGVETPTVETAEADFNTLGIQMRGYFDFGVAKQEYRGAVKSKGAV